MLRHGSVRVLHVDDDRPFAELVETLLHRERESFEVLTETDPEAVLSRLEEIPVDCIVSDYDMPRVDGVELLRRVREQYPDMPFILFTGKGTEEVASEAISAGVTDYLQKGGETEQFTVLANRIENAVEQRESQQQFETLVNNLPGMVYRSLNTPEWDDIYQRGDVEELTGYTRSELFEKGVSWAEAVIHPEHTEYVWEEVQRQLEESGTYELTYRIVTKDGTEKWVWERGQQVGTTDSGVGILEGFITDVTDRKTHEQALQHERERFSTLFENFPEPTVAYRYENEDPHVQAVNEAFTETFGYEQDEALGRSVNELIVPEDLRGEANELDDRAIAGEPLDETVRRRGRNGDRYFHLRDISIPDDEEMDGFAVYTDVTDQTEREHDLEQQRTVFSTLVENLPVGVLVEDERRNILAANTTLGEIFGMEEPLADIVGRDCAQVAEEIKHVFADPDAFITSIEETLASRESLTDEEFLLEDGRILELEYIPYELPDGEANLWVYEDVTWERERQQLLAGLFEESLHGIGVKEIVTDDSGEPVDYIYRRVNDRFEELTGIDGEKAIDRRATEVIDGIEETPFIQRFGEVALEGTSIQFEQYSEPLDRHYEVSAFSPRHGQCISIFSDITARKERERELERYEQFVEQSPDTIVVLNEDMTVQYQSSPSPLLDRDARNVVGDIPLDYIHPDDIEQVKQDFERALAEPDTIVRTEFRILEKDGSWRWFESQTQNYLDTEPIDGVLLTIRDITVQKEKEKELTRQKDRLDEFASFVSHDLRNPLNVAMLRLDLAARSCDSEHLSDVEQALDRMEQLIENLLTLTRQGETVGETESVRLDELVTQCWSNVDTGEATIECTTSRTVRADRSRLATVLENLFRNAVSHGGQSVTITVGDLPDRPGFYVADDGEGISPKERERVFEGGYSTQPRGTGLGLAIVRGIVEAHGWQIRATESEAGGARLEITDVAYED